MTRPILMASVFAIVASQVFSADKSFEFEGFSAVRSTKGVETRIEVGEAYSVTADARRGNIRRLEIRQVGDELRVGRRGSHGLFGAFRRDEFVVTITMPRIEEASASSGASLRLIGGTGDAVELTASSGADLRAQSISFGSVSAKVSSGADMRVSGTCSAFEGTSSSGARLNAEKLVCATVDGRASSGSDLSLHGTSTARLDASSGGAIHMDGGAEIVRAEQSSGGSIRY